MAAPLFPTLSISRAHRRRGPQSSVAAAAHLRELERAVAELVVENRRLRAHVELLETVEHHHGGRLWQAMLAGHGVPREQRRYTAEPAAHVALAVVPATAEVNDG